MNWLRTRIAESAVPVATFSLVACAQLHLGCNALLGNERPARRTFHTDPVTSNDAGEADGTSSDRSSAGTKDPTSDTSSPSTAVATNASHSASTGDSTSPPVSCTDDECPALTGDPCGAGGRCDEGRCQETLDGTSVCCTASCDSACQRCAADGQSCVDALDDGACGVVSCPANNACRRYTHESVTANRCVDGTCGAPEKVCPFLIRGEGESCSDTHLCDAVGNCTVPKLAQGAVCGRDTECTTGHCVDGICCENACNGVCAACRPGTGKCDVVPADDSACPDVECSRWNAECTRSLGNITSNHCARLGTCKSELSCAIENRPQGTGCSGHYLNVCDGNGACGLPTIECEQNTCQLEAAAERTGSQCCFHHPDFDLSEPACKHPNDCVQQFGDWSLACDEHADCRTGESMCCATSVNGMGYLECMPLGECNFFYSPVSNAELCDSPVMGPVQCSNGGACLVTTESLPGFKFCTRVYSEEDDG